MVKEAEETETFEEAQQIITLSNHETLCKSIDKAVREILKNNEIVDETRNIANNLQLSNAVISEKKGKVNKSFIEYIITCLKKLHQCIVIINMLTDVAKQIAKIIETLGTLL